MRILHYFLGFPPYRSGGLTKFALDLMLAQKEDGHFVNALWPGKISALFKDVKINKKKNIQGIINYEIINPLPVSLDEGIIDIAAYTKSGDINVYSDFLKQTKIEVIHVHTLMGIHKEFFEAAKQLGIKTVFTTHDYFGICPKVTLFKGNDACEDDDCSNCAYCNRSALGLKKVMLMQSPVYRALKNVALVKYLRKRHRQQFFEEDISVGNAGCEEDAHAIEYKELRKFYISMLEMVDVIHFNSNTSREVYCRYFTPKSYRVITISHKNIQDNRKSSVWQPSKKIRITYLADVKPAKGYYVLKEALDEIWREGKRNFELHIYRGIDEVSPYMTVCSDSFEQNELKDIFSDTDILVAPSIWYETFGFTVLEAASYGVPVIVSDRVGAKDIVPNGSIIVKAGSVEELKHVIQSMDSDRIAKLRREAMNNTIKTWRAYIQENYRLYDDVK